MIIDMIAGARQNANTESVIFKMKEKTKKNVDEVSSCIMIIKNFIGFKLYNHVKENKELLIWMLS